MKKLWKTDIFWIMIIVVMCVGCTIFLTSLPTKKSNKFAVADPQTNCQITITQIDPDIPPHYLVDVALAFESEFTVCVEIPGREMVSEEE